MPRSPEFLLALVSDMAVTANFAFHPRDGATFCNCYVAVLTAALRCPIPPLLANLQNIWLKSEEGRMAGWMPVDELTASQRAALGYPTVPSWRNPIDTSPGHIGLLMPAPSGSTKLHVTAAGAQNFVRAPLTSSFGLHVPEFFTHQ